MNRGWRQQIGPHHQPAGDGGGEGAGAERGGEQEHGEGTKKRGKRLFRVEGGHGMVKHLVIQINKPAQTQAKDLNRRGECQKEPFLAMLFLGRADSAGRNPAIP